MPASSRGTSSRGANLSLCYDLELGLMLQKLDSDASGPTYLVPEAEAGTADLNSHVVLHLLCAQLRENPKTCGRMETYAVVDWVVGKKVSSQIAWTKTDREGHTNPEWQHVCRKQLYEADSAGASIRIRIYEDHGANPTLCGEARTLVAQLLRGGANGGDSAGGPPTERSGQVCKLPLELAGEHAGTVSVQATLISSQACQGPLLTRVDPGMFETPVKRLGVSGGTAPFFRLRLKEDHAGRSPSYYIGKDLSHAADEVLFYEQARSASLSTANDQGFGPILGFMFEYAGVLSCVVEDAEADAKPRELLVLRNLYDGCRSLRMLDLKIGQKTGSAGWQGKSKTASMRQAIIDGVTNSTCEGFRLEGFDGAPESVTTMNPLLDVGGGSEKTMKRAFRIMLQRMTGAEVFMHFADLHQAPLDPGEFLADVRTPLELAELVLCRTAQCLATLAASCRYVPVPQKWIGSSVALCFDNGELPPRSKPEAEVLQSVKVHIFDWGRSELNLPENHARLSAEQQHDRGKYWGFYAGGIDRLAWEAARAYWHRFSNEDDWREAILTVMDFDSHTENGFIGRLKLLPIQAVHEQTVALCDEAGAEVKSARFGQTATLTCSVEYRKYPAGSRLQGAWRITVVRAQNLPRCNWAHGTTDAFVELTAFSVGGAKRFRQVTSVKQDTLNPEWNETLELPRAARAGVLEEQLNKACEGLGAMPLDPMLPCEEVILNNFAFAHPSSNSFVVPSTLEGPDDSDGLAEWTQRLNKAVSSSTLARTTDLVMTRRLVRGQSVSLVEQGSLTTRLLAGASGVLSCLLAATVLIHPLLIVADPRCYATAVLHVLLAVSALVFELSPCWVSRRRKLDMMYDFLVERVGCLAKATGRGVAYTIQGVLWMTDWLHDFSRCLMLAIGIYQCFIGALHLCMHLGLMSTRLVRKVHRVS